jgi:uncharacterized protein YecE (DUF72 family)
LNNSFYRKKLKDPEKIIHYLLPRAAHLGPKLGPVLFQLSPHWRVNRERLENLLQILSRERALCLRVSRAFVDESPSRFPCEEIQCHILHL